MTYTPSTYEQQLAEDAERRAEHFRTARSLLDRLRPPPGPGRRPEELERLAEQARTAAEAKEAEQQARRERAAEARAAALAETERMRAFKAQLDNALGQARFDTRQAVERGDLEAAAEAAARLGALEVAEREAKIVSSARANERRNWSNWYAVGAGVVR